MYKKAIFLVLAVFLIQPFFIQSQGEHPLIQMLENIPIYRGVTGQYYNPIYYVDIRAAEMARPGVIPIYSFEEYERYVNSESQEDNDVYYLWQATIPSITLGEFSSPLGKEIFIADRYLFFGDWLSLSGKMMEGDFDDVFLTEALSAYDMKRQPADAYTLWCYVEGCEQNGEIERMNTLWSYSDTQPVVSISPYLITTQDYSLIQQIIDTSQGNESSLAQEDIFRAAIEAITLSGNLIQTSFYYSDVATSNNQPNGIFLPEYELFALAHVVDRADEFVIVAMVYNTEEEAHQAVEAVGERITTYKMEFSKKYLVKLMGELDFTDTFATVYQSELTGLWVGLFTFRGDLPSSEPNPDVTSNYNLSGEPRFKYMGLFYQSLFSSAIQGDMNWMATGSSGVLLNKDRYVCENWNEFVGRELTTECSRSDYREWESLVVNPFN